MCQFTSVWEGAASDFSGYLAFDYYNSQLSGIGTYLIGLKRMAVGHICDFLPYPLAASPRMFNFQVRALEGHLKVVSIAVNTYPAVEEKCFFDGYRVRCRGRIHATTSCQK